MFRSAITIFVSLLGLSLADAFVPLHHQSSRQAMVPSILSLEAAGGKKKKRRRKQPPEGTSTTQSVGKEVTVAPKETPVVKEEDVVAAAVEADAKIESPSPDDVKVDKKVIADVANFQFELEDAILKGIENESSGGDSSDDPLVLPDIKDMLKKKEIEQEKERIEEEKRQSVKKIKRSDKEAFRKLLESQPFADADDSYFEQEEYGTVSALLGENAKSFIGIPPGPLQVGHFIGALVIFLMAFVEYPGFPLTNLPTPVRECFQGGLGTIYLINLVLAVLATFKAEERGQSKVLWGIKTFSVGGLAFDQLTQLPTLEEVETAQARKGKRALNQKR
jgi:hypothetical protein